MFHIYILQNTISNKTYIGFTSNLKSRLDQHFTIAKNPQTHKKYNRFQYIHSAINKYGKENFTHTLIESFQTSKEAFEAEQFWIQFFRSWDKSYGYNLTLGGEGRPGIKLSQEHKNKISKKLLGNTNAQGTVHTEVWKQEMKIKHQGEKNSNSKLSPHDIIAIRVFHKTHINNDQLNIFDILSKQYNLSISGLEKIIYRKTWKHV